MKTTGNTIFMTGGTSGIGLELARRFRDLGNTVIISGRRQELLDTIAAEDGIEGIYLDVSDPASITAAFEKVTGSHDVNVLVTMAGIMQIEDLRDPGHLPTAEQTIDINLLGTIRTIATFTPYLLQQTDPVILTVSSGLASVPLTVTPTYSATKAAIHSYTQSLRLQLADTSVKVVELEPPSVRTDLVPGQAESEFAMPLDAFVDEVMELLETQPDATEIQVENVKFLRYGEARGDYADVVATLNRLDPHGR
jgi:uncharacterized oxidoreductase